MDIENNPWFQLPLLLLCFCLCICNSSYWYVGILYNKVSVPTVAWVANREKPIFDRFSAQLKISDGNLVIVNGSQSPVWSTNLTSPCSSSVKAVLRDDGNFALMDGPNSSQIIWQSFDHLANTWLPGAKLGINKRTNTSQLLTSWKNHEDAAPGPFSLRLQPSSEYYIWWKMSEHYWTSGPWDPKARIFSLVPEMLRNYIYNFSYVDNENESYFTYSVYNNSIQSRFIMDFSGQVKHLTWLEGTKQWNLFKSEPRQMCEVYGLCGPFGVCSESTDNFCQCLHGFTQTSPNEWNLSDWSGGCRRTTNLNCGNNTTVNSQKDRFHTLSYMNPPDDPQTPEVGSEKQCEAACLDHCNCTAYAYEGSTCSIWMGDLFNVQQYNPGDSNGKTLDCIIHCDIKPENILLDMEFCPKVADFGLAKLMGREFSRVLTTMRGTRGYLAPEWISGVAITAKADVYSYGMMLFEFVSGKRNSEQSDDGKVHFFPTWAAKKLTEGGDLLELLDPRLGRDADMEKLTRVCRVACWCVQDEERDRPSMGQIPFAVQMPESKKKDI
ncbi:hypothetical protein CRG98_047384 [Punica granatum]|uniref:G-type lectin S-receptor-like serine/threonine-protein kinase At2g19130 n=1 Tax=Punica granatum TaxID=22663 RepID=A0A2I0HKJ3_PUNGR|nr:hypothetical protein CRG98_047384 [Punica granatum]